MNITPYGYQNEAFEWMLAREKSSTLQYQFKGGILADEVGLGKTIMTTLILVKNPMKNTLVILPKSLILQWKEELLKYTSNLDVRVVTDDVIELNNDHSISRVFLVSHSRFNRRGIDDPTKLPYCTATWDRVVIDEAHIIKNKKSKIHKAVSFLNTEIRWALTATPIMNKMTDFIYTMKWVSNNTINQCDCQADKDYIVKNYILRRTKTDVKEQNIIFELPKLHIEVNRLIFESLEEETLYKSTYEDMREQIKELQKTLGNQSIIYALELLLRSRQICCHPQCYIEGMNKKLKKKKKELGENFNLLKQTEKYDDWTSMSTKLEFVKEKIKLTPVGDKTVIFCHFIKEMDIYFNELNSLDYKVCRIDGTTDLEDRNSIVQTFRENIDLNVLLIQINVGGQGFNFQCANHIIITSPTWNPALQHQVIGRCHRTGQKKEVFVNILTIANKDPSKPYVEEFIMELQKEKRKLMAEVLGDERLNHLESGEEEEKTTKKSCNTLTINDVNKIFNL